MKASDLRELSSEELESKIATLSEELFRLRFKNGIRQLENTANLKELRKDIARVKTVVNEKKAKAA